MALLECGDDVREAVERWFTALPVTRGVAVEFCDVEVVEEDRAYERTPYVAVCRRRGAEVEVRGWRRGAAVALETAERGTEELVEMRATSSPLPPLRRSLPASQGSEVGGETRFHLYLDAALELYEMLEYEGVRVDSPEYLRRLSSLHRRLLECADEAASWRALPWLLLLEPALTPLLSETLGRLLHFRYEYVLAGERRLHASFDVFPYPHLSLVPYVREQAFEQAFDALASHLSLHASRHRDAVRAAVQRHDRRWPRSRLPLYVYLVDVQRDAYDLLQEDPPHCVDGYAWVTYGDLSQCLVRRRQHDLERRLGELQSTCQVGVRLDDASEDGRAAHSPLAHTSRDAIERYAARWEQPSAPLEQLIGEMQRRFATQLLSRHGTPDRLAVSLLWHFDTLTRRARARYEYVRERERALESEVTRVPPNVELERDALAVHAMQDMPPCYARLFMRALGVNGRASHLRYLERIRVSQFLFHAGWSLDRAQHAWYLLFAEDGAHSDAAHGYAHFEARSQYARVLDALHRMFRERDTSVTHCEFEVGEYAGQQRGGPASCERLADMCPMRESVTAQEFAHIDIEDLGEAASTTEEAQHRCARYFRSTHPGRPGDSVPVAHPNEFYERALSYGAQVRAHTKS